MMDVSRFLLRVLVAISLMGWGQFVFAQNYYWTVHGDIKFSSALEACKSINETIVSAIIRPDGLVASCQYFPGLSGGSAYRQGDTCTEPAVLNSETGACEASEFENCSNTIRKIAGAEQETYGVTACVALEQKGPPESCPSSFGGNPINFAIGNKFQQDSDYEVYGNSLLDFARSYNSLDGLWRHSYSTHLRIAEDGQSIALVMGHGRESFFTVSGNNVSPSSADIGVLSKTANGWQFLSGDNEHFTFDSTGRLSSWGDASGNTQQLVYSGSQISVTDHLGKSLTFTEDDKHQPLTLTANGVQITYSYNANNRLTAVNKTLGGQTTQRQFHYEDTRNNALLTGITDERGVRYATWSYDDLGRAISSEHANGAERIAIEYSSNGGASVTNELGKVANYQFQTILGVKRITAIDGETSANCANSNSSFTYDERGLLKTKADNKGNLTTYDYNARGLEVSRTEAAGTPQARTVTTEWHPTLFKPVTVTEPARITTYTYDAQGRLLSKSAPNWSYTYNSLGLIETANGPRTDVQDVTTYAYDPNGRLTTVTNALGHITQLSNFDSYGNPQTLIDANGVTTSLSYTPQGWLASVTTAGNTTSFEHDAIGLITKVTRGDGSWLEYTWDGARRLTKITNSLGEAIEYSLDAMGNRTAQRLKDAGGNLSQQQTWVYDELGRLLRSIGAQGQTSQYSYDLNDNPVVSTSPKQHSHTQAYDALDRLVSNTDPLNGVTALAYDAQDNLTQVQDPRGVTTQYQYDGLGNLIQQISPDSGATTFSHDAAGNVISKTDARGVVTTYSYDALNRLTGKQYPANPALNIQYHYDMTADGNKGIGRLTAVQDASGVLGYSYDERGNLVGQLRSVALSNGDHYDSLGYAYDGANQLTRIDYPMGFSVLYPRNAAGQVSQVLMQVGSGQPFAVAGNISYLPFGPLKSLTWGNGISLNRSYDQDYRLTQQDVAVWNSTYGYDANSNITTLSSSLLGELSYSYDALDRLTAEQRADRQQTYSYDAVGNRTSKTTTPIIDGEAQTSTLQTYQYASSSNRLTQLDEQTVTTDAAGNLTQDRANRELVYDTQNRLASVKLAGTPVAEFRYNALGQRTHKGNAHGTTTFLYGPDGQLLGEQQFNHQGSKLSAQYYIWLDSMPLAGVSITYNGQGAITSSEPFYLHSDHLNTPRLATNQAQQNIWQWQSDAFGMGQASGSLTMNLRFPGQYFDQESGLHYNYFRDYDPETGRYVESDPIGLAGGLNTYGYVEGNPNSNVDVYGLNSSSVIPTVCRGWSCAAAAVAQACAGLNPSDLANAWTNLQLQQTALLISAANGMFAKPPDNAYDPNGPKAPGKPGPQDGFQDPKGGDNWVPNPNPGKGGGSHGWQDAKGNVWVPTGQGGRSHGGPHWDVQTPGGGYINVKPKK
jgi:RHS repeat-associated protein